MAQAGDSEKGLKRTLGAGSLIALGIGAIIGAGLFVRTAAAAGEHAGPAVTLSFIVAAIGCAFAGLCYAEFASMIPIAGSAYTYAYATMGELIAWIIGWALILEYALGAATVSIAWSEFLNKLLEQYHLGSIPYEWSHSPFEKALDINNVMHVGIMNVPALFILLLLSLLLIKGTQESALVNSVIVIVKVAIVILFIFIGWKYINPANHTPFLIPADAAPALKPDGTFYDYSKFWNHGLYGVLTGAGIVRAVPGPVWSVTSFMGAIAVNDKSVYWQIIGALIASLGVFLPSFFIVLFAFPFWQNLKKYAVVFRSLEGINAAVVGIMLGASFYLSKDLIQSMNTISVVNIFSNLGILVACTYLLYTRKMATHWLVLGVVCLGLLHFYL